MVDVYNKYEALCLETDEQVEVPQKTLIESKWKNLKSSILHANESAPKLEKRGKQSWITNEILEQMEKRKRAKNTPAYATINKEIQKSCKSEKDKRSR